MYWFYKYLHLLTVACDEIIIEVLCIKLKINIIKTAVDSSQRNA